MFERRIVVAFQERGQATLPNPELIEVEARNLLKGSQASEVAVKLEVSKSGRAVYPRFDPA